MYILHPSLIVSDADRATLDALPANLPETKLKPAEKETIDAIYRQYIHPFFARLGHFPYEEEIQNRWPTGERKTAHQAKRIVLNILLELPLRMDNSEASVYFLKGLNHRKAARILYRNAYAYDITAPDPERIFVANVRIHKRDINGNTYHSVDLFNANQTIWAQKVKIWGGGNMYQQTVHEMIHAQMPDLASKFPDKEFRKSIDLAAESGYIKIIYLERKY